MFYTMYLSSKSMCVCVFVCESDMPFWEESA